MAKNKLEIIIEADDKAGPKIESLKTSLTKLSVSAGLVAGAVAAAGTVISKAAYDLAQGAVKYEALQNTFTNLANSIGENSTVMLNKLRSATRGMVSDQGLFIASNKFVSMGLAKTADEAARLTNMAVQLGAAMGKDATEAAQDFAMMLANQSILRLDNFGISSSQVRDRIDELMRTTRGMTREQAFMQAVMEVGSQTMKRVGDQSNTTAGNLARFQASLENVKMSVGKALLPALNQLLEILNPLISSLGPVLTGSVVQLASAFSNSVIPALTPLIQAVLPALTSILPTIADAFGGLLNILATGLLPVFTSLINALMPLIKMIMPILLPLLTQFAEILASTLVPIIGAMGQMLIALANAVMPLIQAILPLFMQVVTALGKVLQNNLVIIITKLTTWIGTNLANAVMWVRDAIQKYLNPVIDALITFLDKLANGISIVFNWFDNLIKIMKDFLATAKGKAWGVLSKFMPGSLPPIALGVKLTTEEFDKLNDKVNRFKNISFGGLAGYGGLAGSEDMIARPASVAGTIVNITMKDFTLIGDQDQIEYELKPAVMSILRKALPNTRII